MIQIRSSPMWLNFSTCQLKLDNQFQPFHLISQFQPSSIEQNSHCCSIQTVVDFEHSSSSQYVTRQKYFSHPSVVIYSFPTPHIKLELQLQIGGRLVIATHLEQSNYLANQQ
jgi:hypothetical protein